LQRAPWPDGPIFESRAGVGFFFSADLREELIQVMYDADLLVHKKFLSRQGAKLAKFGK
jgi:hypothetical protein